MEKIIKVAIQGTYGAFHEEAAFRYFKNRNLEIIPCVTFKDVVESVESGFSDFGMMAIENTVAGSILPNYSLLQESSLCINGEYYMRIVQNLMVNHGSSLADLKEVYSHPMAIYQSSKFFINHPNIRLIESQDTAESAKKISLTKDKTIGAIASIKAAERYDLYVLAEGIEDSKLNYTRFFVLSLKSNTQNKPTNFNKSSLCFSLPNETGSLSSVLSIFAFYGINLHKIQSQPIIGEPGKYFFHIDIVFDDIYRYRQSLQAIIPLTKNIQILGEYLEGYQSYRKVIKENKSSKITNML
jgi:prephenate dehydratase